MIRNKEILNKASKVFNNEEIRKINISTCLYWAKLIKPMYGPNGLKKLLINPNGKSIITQKGYRILKFLKSPSPISKLVLHFIETQQKACGDGTKFCILLAAFLLEKAENMIKLGIHPLLINKGFSLATKFCLRFIENNALILESNEKPILISLINTILNHSLINAEKEHIANLLLEVIEDQEKIVRRPSNLDISNLIIRTIRGKEFNQSERINGLIINKNKPHPKYPNKIENPRIILLKKEINYLTPNNLESQKEIIVKDPIKYRSFLKIKSKNFQEIVDSLCKKNIKIVLCEKKINDVFIDLCANKGLIALDLVGEKEIKRFSVMLQIEPFTNIRTFTEQDIGEAELAEFRKFNNEEMFFITSNKSPILTLLIRANSNYSMEEIEEQLNSVYHVMIQSLKERKILPGAGALELELIHRLKKYALSFSNKLQYIINEYAKALENIPAFLILNSNSDPLDLVPKLIALHSNGENFTAFDSYSKKIVNVIDSGIYDGYFVKKHSYQIVLALVTQLLRIDHSIIITNRRLYDKQEADEQKLKAAKYDEKLKRFFKDNEEEMFTS